MTSDLIIRVKYEGSTYDLDVLNEVPLRVDMSAIEVGELGRIFGIGSQKFTLPGTKKNNRFFKNAYDIAADNPPGMYNSIDGYVIQNGETLLIGQFQLMEVVTDEDGFVNYNVQISDKVIQFNEELKGKFLRDGDWSAYTHTLSSSSILESWDDNLLSGSVFYPMADYGRTDDVEFPTYPRLAFTSASGGVDNSLTPLKSQQLLPAVRVKDTLDVIFDQVGFNYTGSFTETSDFNNLYLLTKANDQFGPVLDASASATFEATSSNEQSVPTAANDFLTASFEVTDPQSAYNSSTSTYTAQSSGDHTFDARITFPNPVIDLTPADVVRVRLQMRAGSLGSYTLVVNEFIDVFYQDDDFITFGIVGTQNLTALVDDVWFIVNYSDQGGGSSKPDLQIQEAVIQCTSAPVVSEGATINMADQFNPELKSEDVIKGLIQQFNLVMVPDVNNPSTIQIENFDDWVRQGEYKDWNDKYDTSQRVSITHTINELPKTLIITNEEDSDRFSKVTVEQEPYRQYGSLELIASSNNAIGEDKVDPVFAPIILGSNIQLADGFPLTTTGEASTVVWPHLYKFDNSKQVTYGFKPRIGYKVSNTIPSGSSIWIGEGFGVSAQATGSYSTIANVSQLPVVTNSSNDLNFNNTYGTFAPAALNLQNGVTSYENYWETYYNSLYWDDAKKITLSAKFEPYEYKNIRLNDKLLIKNQYYRINKIKGFNVTYRDVVEVELIRLYPAYFQFGEAPTPEPSPTPTSTPTPTPTGTPTATATPTPTPTGGTSTPTPTPTPTPTATPTPTPTATSTPTPPTVYDVGERTDTGAPFKISACGDTCDTTLYSNKATFGEIGAGNGSIIYTDTGGTVLVGGNAWFGITSTTGAPTNVIQIDNSGVVQDDDVCATPTPTPTATPTATPTPTPTPTPTAVPANSYTTFFDASSELTACATSTPDDTIYSSCSPITTSCVLYYNSNLTGPVANGYYHDTTTGDYYYVEGSGVVNEVGSCSAPTPTPVPTATPPPCTGFDIQSVGSATSGTACSGATADGRRRHNGAGATPTINDTVYSNIDCSTTFNGGDLWYYVSGDTSAIQINSSGLVTDQVFC